MAWVSRVRILVNPNSAFIVIWLSLIFLFSLEILQINVAYSWSAITVICINIILAGLMLVLSLGRRKRLDISAVRSALYDKRFVIKRYVYLMFGVYAVISVFDVIYSGGVPLYWKLSGDSRQYVDFGIPTLHGIANSIIYFLSALCVLLAYLKIARSPWLLLMIFIWQFLILSRGTIMVMVVQMLSVYLIMSRPALKRTLILVAFVFATIIFFGVAGDIRQGQNPYYGLLNDEWYSFFEAIPSGFLWIYVYLVSGFNNFLFNAELIEPSYFPVYTFAKLVPSVVYNMLGIEKAVDSFQFVNAGLNVSTIYSGFYSDFGLFAFFPVFIIQAIASVAYGRAQGGSIYDLLAFSVCYQAVVFSPFIDTFFYLPFIFQFFIIWHFKRVVTKC
ncbi:O-antigen ligase [Pseudomonas sp. MIL19]|uniref:O-antigen polymerase n=1 Tax=Pseudomonas sp. MIL19 TaxID=2976979 RepID=UPI0023634B32|nr:O-antigen polymerase [Pseudomonas sp. MIL19]MDD2162453.1 O-antigen ligase [Pseudomonas sp. MIL19]